MADIAEEAGAPRLHLEIGQEELFVDAFAAEPAHRPAIEAERSRLTRLAYRMLGSLAEAEDAVRTLMKATVIIRGAGLKVRMPQEPLAFLTDINALCMQMAAQRRRPESGAAGRSCRRFGSTARTRCRTARSRSYARR